MNCTDACVHPYPKGDSSVCRLALEAKELGFDTIVSSGDCCTNIAGIRILQAAIISEGSVKDVIKQVKAHKNSADFIIVRAGNVRFNRAILTYPGIHILRGVHKIPKNAFDHVSARYAAERGVAVDINLYPLINTRGIVRQKTIRCYIDILRLQRRYNFLLTLSSGAKSVLDLRSVRDFINLCDLFGMEEVEVRQSLQTAGILLTRRGPVEVIE
jgi:ribonuclease P/MRP protein subunit RPP1